MKKKGGYLPEPLDDEDDEPEMRKMRRYYRKKPLRLKAKRWRRAKGMAND